jgi:hypothetical protein
VHDNVALPDPVTLVGATEQEVLLVVRLTTPANPFSAVTVIAEVPADPAFTVTLVGLAAIEKSWKTKVTLVELVVDPLVAVTVAVSVWAVVELHVRVEVAVGGMVTLVGLRRQVALPVATTVRVAVPVKLPRAATVTVEVPPVGPTFAVTLVGLALRLMPPPPIIVTEIDVEFVISLFVPPVPRIVTV